MASLVATLGKTWVIIWNLHLFWFLYNQAEIVSIQRWHQLAEEKSAVDQQTQDIHQKFRMNKISKELGQLSGEELFKPNTKRLDEKSSTTTQEAEESPDYAMDEFHRTNPLTKNLDRMHQHQNQHHHHHQNHHQHHHQNQHHHPHVKMLTMMIFHHPPHR